jgi:two-component system CheB/CheR fusion protein
VRIDDNSASMQPEVAVFDVKEPGDVSMGRSIASLRAMLGWKIPVIILDADKTGWRGAISEPYSCLAKPIWPRELGAQVARFLGRARFHAAVRGRHSEGALLQTVHIVDDDRILRDAASEVLGQLGVKLALYATGEDFLERFDDNDRGCLIVDNVLPGMNGVELLERLQAEGRTIPSIMLTGHANTQSAVRALKAGAIDYVEKPISYEKLLSIVDRALEIDRGNAIAGPNRRDVFHRIEELTQRERQVLDLVVSGHTSKKIATILKISQRTVENHRAAVMKRVGATSLPDLIRIGLQLKSARDR